MGPWTVGNRGRDPFGDAVRGTIPPVKIVHKLAELGAYGVNLHDNDLIPSDASPADRDRIVKEFKQALQSTDMRVPMATTNLFYDPVFKEGAFTSNDARVRGYALQKTMRSMDLGVELGAKTYVFWGGREGLRPTPASAPKTRSSAFARRSTFSASTRSPTSTTTSSRSRPSPTSRAATSSCRRRVTCWPSSTRSITPRWWG